MTQLERLKNNTVAFGFLPEEDQEFLMVVSKRDKESLMVYDVNGDWRVANSPSWTHDSIYRISPDYNPLPESEYVEYDVHSTDYFYYFNGPTKNNERISEALGMVGFAGIRFKEDPDCWYSFMTFFDETGFGDDATMVSNNAKYKMGTPVKVRFRRA